MSLTLAAELTPSKAKKTPRADLVSAVETISPRSPGWDEGLNKQQITSILNEAIRESLRAPQTAPPVETDHDQPTPCQMVLSAKSASNVIAQMVVDCPSITIEQIKNNLKQIDMRVTESAILQQLGDTLKTIDYLREERKLVEGSKWATYVRKNRRNILANPSAVTAVMCAVVDDPTAPVDVIVEAFRQVRISPTVINQQVKDTRKNLVLLCRAGALKPEYAQIISATL